MGSVVAEVPSASTVIESSKIPPRRFLDAAMKGRAYEFTADYESLLLKLGEDPRFILAEPEVVASKVKSMLRNNQVVKNTASVLDSLHNELNPNLWQEATIAGLDSKPVKAKNTHSYSSGGGGSSYATNTKPTSTIERITAQWEGLATEHKVSVGLSYILAAMTAVTAVSRLAHAVEKDPEGKNKMNVSNVMVGTFSALLAAGMAYLGHAQFKAAVR